MSALFRILAAAPIALAFTLLTTAPARASVIYTYTGNFFTEFSGFGSLPAYNGSHRVTGFVELATPLGANLVMEPTSPVSFSFSDGLQTMTNASATAVGIRFWTGANAEIVRWNVNIISDNGSLVRQIRTTTLAGDGGLVSQPGSFQAGDISGSPGVWTRQTAPVPEPSSLALIGLALAGLVARRRVR